MVFTLVLTRRVANKSVVMIHSLWSITIGVQGTLQSTESGMIFSLAEKTGYAEYLKRLIRMNTDNFTYISFCERELGMHQ